MSKLQNPVLMAVIGAPHGIRGELRVKTFTGEPEALGDYGPLFSDDGRRFTVKALRPAKELVVVRFAEVADRAAAEGMAGTELFVERSMLPADLEDDEFYHADLIGLAVEDEAGAPVGRVAAVQNFGGGDLLELALESGGSAFIPFSAAAVPELDVAGGRVRIDRVASGLVADEDEGER